MQSICGVNEYAEYVGINSEISGFERIRLLRKYDALRIFFTDGEKQSTCQKDETCQASVAAGSPP